MDTVPENFHNVAYHEAALRRGRAVENVGDRMGRWTYDRPNYERQSSVGKNRAMQMSSEGLHA